MTVQGRKLITFLFLTFLALLQGCRTNSAPQPPSLEPGREAPKTESLVSRETQPESTKVEKAPKPPVDALKREILPESVAAAPEKESAPSRVDYDTVLLARAFGTPISSEWQYRRNRQSRIVGFEFSNRGGNRILPHRYDIAKNLLFTRDFQFRFDERARQDIHLYISDWVPSRDGQFRLSELMNSVMYFFPRNYLPAISSARGRAIVTLPTGEAVEFDAKTYEISAGVFSEAPVDLTLDKTTRKFPGIHYIGKGVVVRANARGSDPRGGRTAMITTGSPPLECEERNGCHQCEVPAKELWDQHGAFRFKFSTDEEFDHYLRSRCAFGVPRDDAHFVVASPIN